MPRKKIHAPVRNGRLNVAGLNIRKIRREKFPGMSQNELATRIQLEGISMTKNAVQRMEAGEGSINDIQLMTFAKVLGVTVEELLDESIYQLHSKPGAAPDKFGNLEVAEKNPGYS